MDFYVIFALSNIIVSFILGLFIFLKNRKSLIHRTFSLFCLTLFLWSVAYFLWQISDNYDEALFFSRTLMIGAIFIPITYLHFLFALTGKIEEKKKFISVGYLVFTLFLLFVYTPFFVESVSPKLTFPFWPNPGILYHPFLLVWVFCILYSVYFLGKEIKWSSGTKGIQLKYIFVATIIGYVGGATNYFLWYDISIPPVGNWTASVYLALIFYTIVKYRFLDIRIALGRGLVYLISLVAVVGPGLLIISLGKRFPEAVPFNFAVVAGVVVVALLFQPIFSFFQNLISKYFRYTFYDYQKVLGDLGKKLTKILDLDELSSLITDTLINTMKLDRAVVLVKKEKNGRYVIQKNVGFKEENGISLVRDDFLTEYLESRQRPLVYEELSLMQKDAQSKKEKERIAKLRENMKKIEAELCLPLLTENKLSGMIVLGNKVSGDPYFEQDINLLTNLSNQASIALYNARLYSEVQDLSRNLEAKVEEQVRELKKAYRRLQKIDKTKTEFMSIVSHQLRTPLSIIKGQLSMVKEGIYEKDKEKERKVLENVYEANERLIALVNDVLNISRIQSGRVEIKKEKTDLKEVVRAAVERTKQSAEEKGISLLFNEPEEDIPQTEVDISKIENVLLNLIDNSIKYTSEGSVEVSLRKEEDGILIEVKDTGEGLVKEELEKLFETFSRGGAGKKHWIQGAGLGLYIARQFVEMHGGKTWAESEGEGKGSIFYVKLPL